MRRRNELLFAGLKLVLTMSLLAGGSAQATLGGYYGVSGDPERWFDITDPSNGLNTAVLHPIGTTSSSWAPIALPFSAGFPYDGSSYSSLNVASNGFASFDDIGSTSCQSGACFPAPTILAPWWGGMAVCYGNASVSWTTVGVEPDLEVIVQWTNLSYDHSGNNDCSGTDIGKDLFNFQMRMHESGVIDFIYGDHLTASGTVNCGNPYGGQAEWCLPTDFPPPPCTGSFCGFGSANSCLFAAGLEDDNSGTSHGQIALECGASCAHNLFPLSGTVKKFTSGPDLQLGAVDVLGQFSPGLMTTITVEVANVAANLSASNSTGAETVDFYLSLVPGLSSAPILLGSSSALPILAPGAPPVTARATPSLSITIPTGQVYLVAVLRELPSTGDVDPAGKIAVSTPILVTAPLPDLVAVALTSAGSGLPGNAILMEPTVSNLGNAASAAGIPYAYYLSPANAPAVSPTDLQIGLAQLLPSIVAGATAPVVQDTVTLPSWLPAGTYQVGMIIDPGNVGREISKQNNGILSSTLLKVTDDGLEIATNTLPYGYVGGPYQALLTAEHGTAPYLWSVAGMMDNAMPSGLSLGSDGQITGTPSAPFNSRVYFTVTDSSSAKETATKPLLFNNVATQLPLTVVTQQLPTGGFNNQYLVELAAVGGQWPYQWSLLKGSGSLPPGMALGQDGTLTGVPTQAGTFSFQVQVTDSALMPATAQSSRFNLQIAAPGLVTLAASQLPIGVVGQPYVGVLRAAGGSGRYVWSLINDTQLPDAPGSTSKNWNNVEPPGFNRLTTTGQLSGQPSQAGLFALSVQAQEVKSDGSPGASATDTVLLRVVPQDGLYIKNSSLPDATVGLPYSVKLETNAVSSIGSIFFQPVDGSGQDTSAARASIPAGLTLTQDGTIGGTPRATGRYLFLVQAVDQAQSRSTITALSLNVAQDVATGGSSGCATGGTAIPSLFLITLLGVAGLRLHATERCSRGRPGRRSSPS